jgi:hypothetical protein
MDWIDEGRGEGDGRPGEARTNRIINGLKPRELHPCSNVGAHVIVGEVGGIAEVVVREVRGVDCTWQTPRRRRSSGGDRRDEEASPAGAARAQRTDNYVIEARARRGGGGPKHVRAGDDLGESRQCVDSRLLEDTLNNEPSQTQVRKRRD